MSTKKYVAVCAVALGKKVINPGESIPDDVSEGKIKSLLDNESIKEADAFELANEAQSKAATKNKTK